MSTRKLSRAELLLWLVKFGIPLCAIGGMVALPLLSGLFQGSWEMGPLEEVVTALALGMMLLVVVVFLAPIPAESAFRRCRTEAEARRVFLDHALPGRATAMAGVLALPLGLVMATALLLVGDDSESAWFWGDQGGIGGHALAIVRAHLLIAAVGLLSGWVQLWILHGMRSRTLRRLEPGTK